MKDLNALVNPGRNATAPGGKYRWLRMPIRTPLIGAGDDILSVARAWALPKLEPGDLLFLSEKAVACSQGRAIPMEEIRPRPLARFLPGWTGRSCWRPWRATPWASAGSRPPWASCGNYEEGSAVSPAGLFICCGSSVRPSR